MVFRVSEWVGTPAYVVLGEIDSNATERDLAEQFADHLPGNLRIQLLDPLTQQVVRTFDLYLEGRGPLERLADIAKTSEPPSNTGAVLSLRKRLVGLLDAECDAMLSRPRLYAHHNEALTSLVLQNQMHIEALSGRRRGLTSELHAFGAQMTDRFGVKWWYDHPNATTEETVAVLRAWREALRT